MSGHKDGARTRPDPTQATWKASCVYLSVDHLIMLSAKITAAFLFPLLGSSVAFSQCEDFVITSAGSWLECRGNGVDGQSVVLMTHVSWIGGTTPYEGFHSAAGGFASSGGEALWEIPWQGADGQVVQAPLSVDVTDGNGCVATWDGSFFQQWIDPADQFITGSVVWDGGSGRATVTLVDNPNDPGTAIPNEENILYGLYSVDGGAYSAGGLVIDVHQSSPDRLVFENIPPGNYEVEIGHDPGAPGGSTVPCVGVAAAFTVVAGTPLVLVRPRVFLGGAFASGSMSDQLRSLPSFPLGEPYSALGYSYTGAPGTTTVSPALLAQGGLDAIVDWVVVELRIPSFPYTVLGSRPALLQRDGDVVALDGTSALSFNLAAGNYRMSVLHRNHLGVMTAAPYALSSTSTTIDLSSPSTGTFGTNARANINGTMVLWPGDITMDGVVRYTGTGNDRDPVLQAIGGSTPTNVVNTVYSTLDVNLDGAVRYTGSANDRDFILTTVGGTVPTAVRTQQLP